MDLVKSSTKQEIRIITKKFKSATIANAKISNSQSKPLIIIKSNKTDPEFKQDAINPKTIEADSLAVEALQLMRENNISQLIVTMPSKSVVGLEIVLK